MKRTIREMKPWLKFLTKVLEKYSTLRGTAEKLGVSYEVVRYYALKYNLPYRYRNLTGWKFPKEDLGELMKGVRRIKLKKRGLYQRFGRRVDE